MKQQARNLTDVFDGFLRGKWKLIHDRDPPFSAGFRATLGTDVTTIKMPPKSPNLNSYAKRFVLSIKSECLDRIVPLGEKHLRATVRAFIGSLSRGTTAPGFGERADRADDVRYSDRAQYRAVSGLAAC